MLSSWPGLVTQHGYNQTTILCACTIQDVHGWVKFFTFQAVMSDCFKMKGKVLIHLKCTLLPKWKAIVNFIVLNCNWHINIFSDFGITQMIRENSHYCAVPWWSLGVHSVNSSYNNVDNCSDDIISDYGCNDYFHNRWIGWLGFRFIDESDKKDICNFWLYSKTEDLDWLEYSLQIILNHKSTKKNYKDIHTVKRLWTKNNSDGRMRSSNFQIAQELRPCSLLLLRLHGSVHMRGTRSVLRSEM